MQCYNIDEQLAPDFAMQNRVPKIVHRDGVSPCPPVDRLEHCSLAHQTINYFVPMLLLCLAMSGCNRTKDYELDGRSFKTSSLKMVERETGIYLPASSRGLNLLYVQHTIKPMFVARIQIPDASHEDVAQQIEKFPVGGNLVRHPPSEAVKWWNPTEQTARAKRTFDHGEDYVRALLCKENEGWILYIEWIST
jgi:hypothetical protein